MKNISYQILFIIIFLFISSCANEQGKKNPKINNGKIDLTEWNFEKNGIINLTGDWEFYWSKLYTSKNFSNNNIKPVEYISLPALWNGKTINNKKISGKGYATFRSTIDIKNTNDYLSLKIGRIETAYKLFINGKLVKQVGEVSKIKDTAKPQWKVETINFQPDSTQIEIILQVSNYHHRKGGVSGKILLGTENQITKHSNKTNYINVLIFGILFIMSLYHFGLFTLRKKDKAALYFGGISIFILEIY